MRLIDADALLPMMKYATTDSEIGVFPIKIGFNAIAKVIDDAPTIDAVPVRHGKWIPCAKSGLILTEQMRKEGIRWYGFKCSACNFVRKGNAPRDANYCECCGARMDEDHA